MPTYFDRIMATPAVSTDSSGYWYWLAMVSTRLLHPQQSKHQPGVVIPTTADPKEEAIMHFRAGRKACACLDRIGTWRDIKGEHRHMSLPLLLAKLYDDSINILFMMSRRTTTRVGPPASREMTTYERARNMSVAA